MALNTQGKLTPKAEQAITALLKSSTLDEAAQAAKVSKRTLSRWMQSEEFRARFIEAQRAVFDDAILEMQATASLAVAALRKNLTCGNFFAENSAAIAILSQSRRARELDELQEKVAHLEKQLERLQKRRSKA